MNKRKKHVVKKVTRKNEKKANLIGSIVMVLIAIVFGLTSPFTAKAIYDGNMLFILLPFILIVTVFAAFIIWGMLKK